VQIRPPRYLAQSSAAACEDCSMTERGPPAAAEQVEGRQSIRQADAQLCWRGRLQHRRTRFLVAAIVGAAMLAATATAEAAQRYASPDGTGESCSKQEPCSLQIAIGNAGNHDEVIVGPGAYALGSTPISAGGAGLDIHGDFGGPAPKIEASYKGT